MYKLFLGMGGQYGSPPPPTAPQYGDSGSGQASPGHPQSQHNMFPAMSVNVSMSMNVGMGGMPGQLPGGQYAPSQAMDQWGPHHHHQPTPQYSPAAAAAAQMTSQYSYGHHHHHHQNHSYR